MCLPPPPNVGCTHHNYWHPLGGHQLKPCSPKYKRKPTSVGPAPAEEYALLLEVIMADCPRHPQPPTFSWNVGMVLHVLKGDLTLRDLEHV